MDLLFLGKFRASALITLCTDTDQHVQKTHKLDCPEYILGGEPDES